MAGLKFDLASDELQPGLHLCWVVDESSVAQAEMIEAGGTRFRQKTLAFGPCDSHLRTRLQNRVALAADPWTDFLGGERFEPAVMYDMFRRQSALAESEGYDGLRLVADMDWLLPAKITTSQLVDFEVMLDRVVHELGATVVCAYRRATFTGEALDAMSCVHSATVGLGSEPQFQIFAASSDTWCLSGEVDRVVADTFAAAINSAVSSESCHLDVSQLRFIDVAGTRAFAHAAAAAGRPVTVVGACASLQRCWSIAGFGAAAPFVTFES